MPFLTALLLAAIITPTDPVVTTPIVTGSLAVKKIPVRVRQNLSGESGLNDGLGYLFVLVPVLLLTLPAEQAWEQLALRVLLRDVVGAAIIGAACGFVAAALFRFATGRRLMEETSYLGFIIPLALAVLGLAQLMGTDAILAVFIAAAVFGQRISQSDEEREDKAGDVFAQFLLLPVFILLGIGLPWEAWIQLGPLVPLVLAAAVLLRRLVAMWAIRPLVKKLHTVPETAFMSWFGAIGVSALFYAAMAERLTGRNDIFPYIAMAITLSVFIHGMTSVPLSRWIQRVQPGRGV